MNNFDQLYFNILKEARKHSFNRPRLSLDKIKLMIKQGYKEVRERIKKLNNGKLSRVDQEYTQYKEGEAEKIQELINKIYQYDAYYIDIFNKNIDALNKNKNNPEAINKILIQLIIQLRGADFGYAKNIANHVNEYVRQGAKIAVVRILNASNLTEIVEEYNAMGWPVLKFHLLPKYLQLKILLDLGRSKQLDPKLLAILPEKILDSKEASQALEKELENYFKETTTVSEPEKNIENFSDITPEIEEPSAVPQRSESPEEEVEKAKQNRLERIRQAQSRINK